ncbi:MAG: arylamine N-acetyltransferase, partial [Caldilineaceae bacterium]|nr:arylamine N-acetyltransferase [Caldilineaceae bacterium]
MPNEVRVRHAAGLRDQQIGAYLARLGLPAVAPRADLAGLTALQSAHLLAVPFENLSIGWGEWIDLDEEALFAKIVTRGRGGFCYELNGLFWRLLTALGFRVTRVAAGVWSPSRGAFGPPFDHMALLVHFENAGPGDDDRIGDHARDGTGGAATGTRYLVDVGFGASARAPLQLPDGDTRDVSGRYRVAPSDVAHHFTLAKWREEQGSEVQGSGEQGSGEQWQAQYRFSTVAQPLAAYAPMCGYHQTAPESSFTQRSVCSLATPVGRVSLSATELIITTPDSQARTPVTSVAEHDRLLA